jgi:hypothetical protein
MTDQFAAAIEVLRASENRPEFFAHPFVDLLPVSGAAVSTVGPLFGSETLSATDDLAARIDELQFDLSEGPCWDALAARRPVLESSLATGHRTEWPSFGSTAAGYGVSSIFAFPLVVGALPIGAVDLYSIPEVALTNEQCRQAMEMSDIIGRHVLRRAIRAGDVSDEDGDPGTFSRRVIHQATGVVIAQLSLTPDDARLVIQGHAFAAGRPMKDIARQIVDGDLSFEHRESGIEASE